MSSARHVVSLFSGAGGMSLGFSQAGLKPDLAAEIDGDAVSTYRSGVEGDVVIADIGSDPGRISAEAKRRGISDGPFAVIGGPPCQGFSTAGARDADDPRNRLVFAYLNLVRDLRPNWFLFENVEGLLTSGGGQALEALATRFGALGYSLRIEKVNFAGYGVPQSRKRVLIVGNRLGLNFRLPEPTHSFDGKKHRGNGEQRAPGVGEALAGLPGSPVRSLAETVPYASPEPQSRYDAAMREGTGGIAQHICANYERDRERIALLRPGQSLKDIPQHLWPESYRSRAFRRVADGMPTERRGGAPSGLRRLTPDHVSLTITSLSCHELVHPEQDRPLSLRECARLQGFPDAVRFSGDFRSIARQVGNAFPPPAARLFANWLLDTDGAAGAGSTKPVAPGLIGFKLTEASGMSPALADTEARLMRLTQPELKVVIMAPRPVNKQRRSTQEGLFARRPRPGRLDAETRKLITRSRTAKPVSLGDRELARLISVALHDLGHDDLVPDWVGVPKGQSYYELPLDWFSQDQERPFEFDRFFVECDSAVESFRTIFQCLCELHKRRRKFALILQSQPIPTMDQVARRGLLEHGAVALPGLTSWLMWRKWIYDIDNRSAQETGYLFEPILATSLGGEPYSPRNSPVTRDGGGERGRQVDCLIDVEDRLAYEFKARVTIAASNQGRFAEEMTFPEDCRKSGYKPVLLVMDPTPNPRLDELVAAFKGAGGLAFLGNDVWAHLEERSGSEIARFVERYIKEPIVKIAQHEDELLDLSLSYTRGATTDSIRVSVGDQSWNLAPRPHREEATGISDGDSGEDE